MASDHPDYIPREEDREFYQRELASFIPDKVFDAHTHVWHPDHNVFAGSFPPLVDYENYVRLMGDLYPGRVAKGLFIPTFRDPVNIPAANQWTGEQTAKDPNCRGHFFITPEDDPEWVRQEVKRLKLHGLKCYHTLARNADPTWEAEIPDYLPESHIRVAHEEGWTITLHMVRDRALADPVNQAAIRRYCESYPSMRLILAHAARGFNPWHTIEGIESLRGLDNVWFDTSAVTEAGAFEAIVDTMGHEKLMYGTDFHVSHTRGRCIAIGDSFHWLYADDMDLDEKHISLQPVLVGLESLRSIRLACDRLKLSERQVDDIFYGNAAALLDIE